jgi:hypothetical protein
MPDDDLDGLQLKYFILKPRGNSLHAIASRAAMRAYAECIVAVNPKFAREVEAWASKEEMSMVPPDTLRSI